MRVYLNFTVLVVLSILISHCGDEGSSTQNRGVRVDSKMQAPSGKNQEKIVSRKDGLIPQRADIRSVPLPNSTNGRLDLFKEKVENAISNDALAEILYNGLGDPDSDTRIAAHDWLISLIQEVPGIRQEIDQMQMKVVNPGSWRYGEEILQQFQDSKNTLNSEDEKKNE